MPSVSPAVRTGSALARPDVAILGPDGEGVVVASPDGRAAAMDVLTLRAAGVRAATPGDLGIALREPPQEIEELAAAWGLVTRRPAVARAGQRMAVGQADGTVEVVDPPALSTDLLRATLPAPRRIAVFGGAWVREAEEGFEEAVTLGRATAQAGIHLVCGGYGGIMEAVSRGSAEAAGVALGIPIAVWEGRVAPNPHLTHLVVADHLLARFPLLLDADAWVAYPGGVGTLAEVALCWNLMQMSVAPRPLVLVGEGWGPVLDTLRERLLITEPSHLELVRVVDADEAASAVLGDAPAR